MKFLTASLMHLTTNLDTARFGRRINDKGDCGPAQEKVFKSLIGSLAKTRYGMDHEVEAGMDTQTFRKLVPLTNAAMVEPYLEATRSGSPDEIWPGRCRRFVRTNGAVTGTPRLLPLTNALLDHFRSAIYQTGLMHTASAGHAGIFQGSHLYLTAAAPLESGDADLSAVLIETMPRWVEKFLFEPGRDIAAMADGEARIQQTAARAVSQDLTLIAGSPPTLVRFVEAVIKQLAQSGRAVRNLSDIWPNLEVIVHSGSAVAPHLEDLKQAFGRRVVAREVFAMAEAVVAVQDGKPDGALRVLDNTGVYFEFFPLYAAHEDHKQALPLSGVRTGVDYELIVTTPGGLCRYRTDEIVRFVTAKPARLVYRGRRSLALPLKQHFLYDHDLVDVMARICRRHDWSLAGFHVNDPKAESGDRHEWWVELKPPCKETPISKIIEEEIDEGLKSISEGYQEMRSNRELDAPVVRLITPGVFQLCRTDIGRQHGEHAYPVCRPDRQVADQLMQYSGVQAE